jgi:hypothetical protein
MGTGAIGGPIFGGLAGAAAGHLVGDMMMPPETVNDDLIMQQSDKMQEAEIILRQAQELNKRLNEICRRTGGCYTDDPCD